MSKNYFKQLEKRGLYNELYLEIQNKLTAAHNSLDRALKEMPPRQFLYHIAACRLSLDECCKVYKELQKLFPKAKI